MKFGFGKRIQPRQFDYLPRFYDEEKEHREALISQYSGETDDEEKIKSRIRSGMRQKYNGDAAFRSLQTRNSNLRLVYIILILCVITYFIFKSDRISNFIESMGFIVI